VRSTHYTQLPLIYDRWQRSYGKDYSAVILPRLVTSLRERSLAPSTMVDVGCGTGSLALLMAKRGWKVWGIDASEGMIAEAWKKAVRAGLPAIFLRQDMRTLRLPEHPILAVSVFDTLNHLAKASELRSTFRRIHAALAGNGWFMFDVNNERCYRLLWTREQSLTHRDFTLLLDNRYSAGSRRAESRVRIMLPAPGGYVVLRETVKERCFTPEEIEGALTEAGFEVDEKEDFNPTGWVKVGKIKTWWIARRLR
jgi:SAM-dependent methyltransferase